jgi:hypothetical protein
VTNERISRGTAKPQKPAFAGFLYSWLKKRTHGAALIDHAIGQHP